MPLTRKKRVNKLLKKHKKTHKKIRKIRGRIAKKQARGKLGSKKHKSIVKDIKIFEKGVDRLSQIKKELKQSGHKRK